MPNRESMSERLMLAEIVFATPSMVMTTFTGAALCAVAGMALLWRKLDDQNATR